MKYINPGMCQLFQYQTLNQSSIGIDEELNYTKTGHYINLSSNDSDIFYKEVDDTKTMNLLFDICVYMQSATSVVRNWSKLIDFYNVMTPSDVLELVYKQLKSNQYQFAFRTKNGNIIGEQFYLNANEIHSIELSISRNIVTTISVYIDGKLKHVISDTSLGDGILNRFNVYCVYQDYVIVAMSHIIYSDTSLIGNERIKMLKVFPKSQVLPNGQSTDYTITEILDDTMYKDIVGFGVISNVENTDNKTTTINTLLNTYSIDEEYDVNPNTTYYRTAYIETNPETEEAFVPSQITNAKIILESSYE